jgi:hypothetical protein
LPPVGRAELDAALADVAALVTQYCGGTVRTEVLDSVHPEVRLG